MNSHTTCSNWSRKSSISAYPQLSALSLNSNESNPARFDVCKHQDDDDDDDDDDDTVSLSQQLHRSISVRACSDCLASAWYYFLHQFCILLTTNSHLYLAQYLLGPYPAPACISIGNSSCSPLPALPIPLLANNYFDDILSGRYFICSISTKNWVQPSTSYKRESEMPNCRQSKRIKIPVGLSIQVVAMKGKLPQCVSCGMLLRRGETQIIGTRF